ncbi:MAG: ATP-dependent DNA helicase RecG [Holosporales bacterium]|nr:ATP-dependent DNA helicase RecG [Holosporales bacterium]
MLLHVPTHGVRRQILKGAQEAQRLEKGACGILSVLVQGHVTPARSSRAPYRIQVEDAEGIPGELVFFHGKASFLRHRFPTGRQRIVSGMVDASAFPFRMVHPECLASFPGSEGAVIEPVYPLTAGLSNRAMGTCCKKLLTRLPDLPEWIPEEVRQRFHWPSWREALKALHEARTLSALALEAPARQRLFFDELLAHQLALGLLRMRHQEVVGRCFPTSITLRTQWLHALPFTLTSDQTRALEEIDEDLSKPVAMARLLQGEVGSGKTLVALGALLRVVEAGAQAAILAPTEVLARQHYDTILRLMPPQHPVALALLVGKTAAADRRAQRKIFQDLASGRLQLVVGTHALLEPKVMFHDLGLVVIDEQHRFGVRQRQKLEQKGSNCACLSLSATPIPRTLLLTEYGDLAISTLREKPAGRPPVTTRIQELSQVDAVMMRLETQLEGGEQAFWVCPLVEESEKVDLMAAECRFESLKERFGARVGVLHGRLSSEEKHAVLTAFLERRISVLVATTVIEVGLDVPSATIMIIEHAERFGLSQLHQLRGRVGRGEAPAFCLLLYARPLSPLAYQRLQAFKEISDGFSLAEKDLRLRGGGDLSGTQQSGFSIFRLGNVYEHPDLLEEAHALAGDVLTRTPRFFEDPADSRSVLLKLFGKGPVAE